MKRIEKNKIYVEVIAGQKVERFYPEYIKKLIKNYNFILYKWFYPILYFWQNKTSPKKNILLKKPKKLKKFKYLFYK